MVRQGLVEVGWGRSAGDCVCGGTEHMHRHFYTDSVGNIDPPTTRGGSRENGRIHVWLCCEYVCYFSTYHHRLGLETADDRVYRALTVSRRHVFPLGSSGSGFTAFCLALCGHSDTTVRADDRSYFPPPWKHQYMIFALSLGRGQTVNC